MNFKLLFILSFLFGCGVKGPPKPDADSMIKSWPQSIIDEYEEENKIKKK